MPTPTAATTWLTPDEVADYLRVSLSWVRKQIAANDMPHKHLGRRVKVNRAALDAWVDEKPGV